MGLESRFSLSLLHYDDSKNLEIFGLLREAVAYKETCRGL